jgi:hypothetical protein
MPLLFALGTALQSMVDATGAHFWLALVSIGFRYAHGGGLSLDVANSLDVPIAA